MWELKIICDDLWGCEYHTKSHTKASRTTIRASRTHKATKSSNQTPYIAYNSKLDHLYQSMYAQKKPFIPIQNLDKDLGIKQVIKLGSHTSRATTLYTITKIESFSSILYRKFKRVSVKTSYSCTDTTATLRPREMKRDHTRLVIHPRPQTDTETALSYRGSARTCSFINHGHSEASSQMLLFSTSSSISISCARQPVLQNAFSPLYM